MSGILQVQRIKWMRNRSMLFETSENTGSNNLVYMKLLNNYLYTKFREAEKFKGKKFVGINLSTQYRHIRSDYTIFSKISFYSLKGFLWRR